MPICLYITPERCPAVVEQKTIYLSYLQLTPDEDAPVNMFAGKPGWGVRGRTFFDQRTPRENDEGYELTFEAKFCPHCAAPVPEIELRQTEEKICAVSDGGYYCDTCQERLMGCECKPPEYRYQICKKASSDAVPSSS